MTPNAYPRFPAGQRQLFFDSDDIAQADNLRATFHKPQKRGAVIRREPAIGGTPEIRRAPVCAPEVRRGLSGLGSEARSRARRRRFGAGPQPGTDEPPLAAPGRDPAQPAPVDLGSDLSEASYRAVALTPLGPLDRYEVLCAPSATQRLAVAHRVVADAVELLRARIEMGIG